MPVIDFLRAVVRPVIQLALGGVIIWMTVWLALKFGDAELAKYVVPAVVAAGLTLLGTYAGERAAKKKEEK